MAQHSELPTLLDRPTTARLLGIKQSTLRKWWSSTPARGPRGLKLGLDRQSRVMYPASEVAAFAADPLRYARHARPDGLPAYDPPRRGGRQHGR
jgi:hypothetical protein